MRTKELFAFIRERHSIYVKKTAGIPKPWTKDAILRTYRFCNVYRELDTQTKWLRNNWEKHAKKTKCPDYWFACCVFRLTNWNETAEQLGYPVPWNKKHFTATLGARKAAGQKVYSGAYTISTNGVKMEKHLYLADQLDKIWKFKEQYRFNLFEEDCLEAMYERLMTVNCMGSFLAAQVVADVKFEGDAKKAPDWWTFAAPGPGSERGLNRVFNRPIDTRWALQAWRNALSELQIMGVNPLIEKHDMPRLSAQDLQNCLCEFDKYERVRLGEGRPRSTYPGV